jgi:hypothetical protein
MYTDSIEQLRGTAAARQVRVRAETALAAFTTPDNGGWIMFGKYPSSRPVTLEITGSWRSLSDPDPKMAGERVLKSPNQFVNGPPPERAANDEKAPVSSRLHRAC